MHIAATGLDPDRVHHHPRLVTQALIFAVAQGLGGCNRDAVAGVHTHRVEVFDAAYHHKVVLAVTHHLKFIFFPAQYTLLDQDFVHGRLAQPMFNFVLKFILGKHNATAAAA